jgi:diketogulonate reductase-like aldo/keto reductase
MAAALLATFLATASAQDLFLTPHGLAATQLPAIATVDKTIPMKNAAKPGMKFPVMGLGCEGHGWQGGPSNLECWHWPQCGNNNVDAVAAYIKEAKSRGEVARLDTGYPYGDPWQSCGICKKKTSEIWKMFNKSSAGFLQAKAEVDVTGCHQSCDTKGIGLGIRRGYEQSGAKREDVFVTLKAGYAGPMGGTNAQVKSLLEHLDIEYADLCLIHLPEVGPGTGSHVEYGPMHCVPKANHKPDKYDASKCRVGTYKNLVENFKSGLCKAIGVNNWNVTDIEESETAGLPLPSVVQYKFHLHQSSSNQIQKDLIAYTQKNGIIFNGFAPLGVPDWVTFNGDGMKATLFEEPLVQEIATKMSKTPAQVLLRWVIQQGIATHARTNKPDHMKDNLDIFDWELSSDDMAKLSSMPQCNTQRGLPYAKGDPNGGAHHDHVVSITEHC